jgi:RND family efflux transporter MFP subunit
VTRVALLCIIMLAGLLAVAPAFGQASGSEEIGITKPSEESKRSFLITGVVADIPVKAGQAVRKGDTLIQLDDSVERKTLEILEIEAASTLLVEGAEKEKEQAEVEHQRQVDLMSRGAGSKLELLRTKVAAELADVKVRQAKEELEKKKVERDKQARQVAMMRVDSPIEGVVASIDIKIGEIVDPREPAAVVVKNDPLWLEVNLPSAQAAALGDVKTLRVRYQNEADGQAREARIIFLAPVVDAASDKRLVRLELPNPEQRPAGLQMIVELPTAVAEAGR